MIRCTCGNALVSVDAICDICLPNGIGRGIPRVVFNASAECLRCGDVITQPRPGRSAVHCPNCGTLYGLDFFRA